MTDGPDLGCAPPLSIYVHLPWCVSKCPYCDFNSHATSDPPFASYVTRLLVDLDQELEQPAARRPIVSIYLGGGTPSLFPGTEIERLLAGIRARVDLVGAAEITLEANPGTGDARRFEAYRRAGINRLSLGVQSLAARRLSALGRIHDPHDVVETVRLVRSLGFDNLNLDLMFGLPEQDLAAAALDLEHAIALAPEHLSYYQLTLEPGTVFAAHPPPLPDPDLVAEMGEQGLEHLTRAGYGQYEVSAHARTGRRCRHNLNYWQFGDYLGIGAGAHGKLTHSCDADTPWRVRRTVKRRQPTAYLEAPPDALIARRDDLNEPDLIFELVLNALRLTDGFALDLVKRTTGLSWSRLAAIATSAEQDGLLLVLDGQVRPTAVGRRFLDDLIGRFLPEA
ncbi:MAG: radical SAM family heme chaperone HemW [Sphingobacteriia bacterium]|nr:radical SAM family heme chaperone HemW [Sphingobacteriia bacterium]NCC41181.1 radical SAM family heme chaperone HemW [Gammaproteobacteria bacterium]